MKYVVVHECQIRTKKMAYEMKKILMKPSKTQAECTRI